MDNSKELDYEPTTFSILIRMLHCIIRKYENEEEIELNKLRKAIEERNLEDVRMYAENAEKEWDERRKIYDLIRRIQRIATRLFVPAVRAEVSDSLGDFVKSLKSSLAIGDIEKMLEIVDEFEHQLPDFRNLKGSASPSVDDGTVESLTRQVLCACGLTLPQPIAAKSTKKDEDHDAETVDCVIEKVDEDDASK